MRFHGSPSCKAACPASGIRSVRALPPIIVAVLSIPALVSPSAAQEVPADTAGLFTGCSSIDASVFIATPISGLTEDDVLVAMTSRLRAARIYADGPEASAENLGIRVEQLRRDSMPRWRRYVAIRTGISSPRLGIYINHRGTAVVINTYFHRALYDPLLNRSKSAQTWIMNFLGSSADPEIPKWTEFELGGKAWKALNPAWSDQQNRTPPAEFILSEVRTIMDVFIDVYLRVNAKECGKRTDLAERWRRALERRRAARDTSNARPGVR